MSTQHNPDHAPTWCRLDPALKARAIAAANATDRSLASYITVAVREKVDRDAPQPPDQEDIRAKIAELNPEQRRGLSEYCTSRVLSVLLPPPPTPQVLANCKAILALIEEMK